MHALDSELVYPQPEHLADPAQSGWLSPCLSRKIGGSSVQREAMMTDMDLKTPQPEKPASHEANPADTEKIDFKVDQAKVFRLIGDNVTTTAGRTR